MSLRELAASDSRLIIDTDGTPAILTSPAGTIYTAQAIVNRTGVQIDADGLPVSGDNTEVTMSLVALAEKGLSDPDDLKAGVWPIVTTDVTGREISGRVASPLINRTLGWVMFYIKRTA